MQCRLSAVAPVRAKGFDHTVQLAYSAAAGAARALGLEAPQVAHAVAIAGTANNALRVTRTGSLSHWKGLAAPYAAFSALQAVFLARHGVTGPLEVFEGNKGFMDTLAGRFTLDWEAEPLDQVCRTILKRYNAEVHAQSTLECILELREQLLPVEQIERVEVDLFQVGFDIIGGGEEGAKRDVQTKEQADHSLPYLVAVALLDGEVGPDQFEADRVVRDDVQRLLRRVVVRPDEALSRRFPEALPSRVRVRLRDGRTLGLEKLDYQGFVTRPMSWERMVAKFERLAAPASDADLRAQICERVHQLESVRVSELTQLLSQVRGEAS